LRADDAAFLGAAPPPIEDLGLIGDGRSAALVTRAGTVNWLCWPRFDSPACFAALLGGPEHGAWRIAPEYSHAPARRAYGDDTLLLDTHFSSTDGTVTVTDAMLPDAPQTTLVRLVAGHGGAVAMRMAMAPRFGYGAHVPALALLPDGAVRGSNRGRWRAAPCAGADAGRGGDGRSPLHGSRRRGSGVRPEPRP
jgi:GH15 family glucan-1,4-alpha-glucosidase